MGLLEEVSLMLNQGKDDSEIAKDLNERGYSLNEITNTINQAKIKKLVKEEKMEEETYNQPQENYGEYQQYPQQQEYNYYPQEYQQQDSSSLVEIASQVFSEKAKEMNKKIDEMKDFKVLMQTKIENIDERLKRIEKIIDNLQIKIIQEVGSYGQNLNSIRKEMEMMQDSFTKITHKKKK